MKNFLKQGPTGKSPGFPAGQSVTARRASIGSSSMDLFQSSLLPILNMLSCVVLRMLLR